MNHALFAQMHVPHLPEMMCVYYGLACVACLVHANPGIVQVRMHSVAAAAIVTLAITAAGLETVAFLCGVLPALALTCGVTVDSTPPEDAAAKFRRYQKTGNKGTQRQKRDVNTTTSETTRKVYRKRRAACRKTAVVSGKGNV